MAKKEQVPAIRFQGFADPWEQRKLGDFTGKVIEKNTGMSVTETFTNSAEFGVISQLDFFDHAISKDESISGYTIVCPEDFVYNPRISVTAPVGPINRNRLNRAGVMSPLYTVFRTDGSIDRVYLEHFFKTSGWHSYMQLNGNSGARSDRFSIGDDTFFAMPIPAPSLEEQRQLAGFLESLDTLITLHQRKYDKLVAIKRSMLEKMFPREGSRFPEIRFAGFTDPWEQRKYSDVIDLLSGQDYEPSAYNDERIGIPYMTGASCVIEGKTIVNRWTLTPKCIANKGDVLLVCKGSGCGTIAVMMQERAHIARQFMALKCKPGLNKRFNFYLANSVIDDIKKDARGLIAGIAREAVLAEDVCIPGMEEQYQIGELLTKLDDLITLHQCKPKSRKGGSHVLYSYQV